MRIRTGDTLPSQSFMIWGGNGPEPATTELVFAGKNVVLFAVPGAFTPTCSAKHLPGFASHARAFEQKGFDTIACTSVNDIFVLHAWAAQQDPDGEILMLADGNADFARAVGLDMDGSSFGMGIRSQRYAMTVRDQIVDRIFVEEPGEFQLSSAENVLKHL